MSKQSFMRKHIKPLRRIVLSSLRHPSLLVNRPQYVLLLSHMRAYTSVLSHIMGSHPDINGYYELHLPYKTSRDLLSMTCKISKNKNCTLPSPYFFDKVLHNQRTISQRIIDRDDVHILFMLRKPEATIKSFLNMRIIMGNDPDLDSATTYYHERMEYLTTLARMAKGKALYIESESLIEDSADILASITKHIDLDSPLQEEYQTFPKTGVPGSGDPSEYIQQGKIVRDRESHDTLSVPQDELNRLQDAYDTCREAMLELNTT